MKLVYLQWLDATSPVEGSWWSEEEALNWASNDDYWVEEVGWILKETKEYILFCSKKSTTTNRVNNIVQYGNLLRVPKPWIRKRKTLKV